jgi:hypothetical protein
MSLQWLGKSVETSEKKHGSKDSFETTQANFSMETHWKDYIWRPKSSRFLDVGCQTLKQKQPMRYVH